MRFRLFYGSLELVQVCEVWGKAGVGLQFLVYVHLANLPNLGA